MTSNKSEKAVTIVEITANPFLQDATIAINGQILDFECTHKRCTQGWVDEIFYKIYDRINGISSLALVFHGLEIDYEDVVDAAKAAASYLKFSLISTEFIPARTAEERLSEMKTIISDISQNSNVEEFQSAGFHADFEQILAPNFAVHVVATMSAGKSTLINAMIGKDILPAMNRPCTATITAVYDSKQAGDSFVGEAKDSEGKCVFMQENLTRQDVEEWNKDAIITDIDIRGDLRGIKASQHVSLILFDTPGPNNSRNFEHRKTTFKSIETSDMSLVLYVMNATQLGIDDDRSLLTYIHDVINKGGKAARDRFLFVLNKIDEVDPDGGESVAHVLASAKDYLAENGIKDARIFPVAAQTTKLARMAKAGIELGRRDLNHLNQECENIPHELQSRIFDCISVSPSVRRALEQAREDAFAAEDLNAQAEIFGGIPVIEAVIAEYMEKYGYVHKVADAHAMLCERYDDAYQKKVGDLESIIGSSEEELKKLNRNIEKMSSIIQGADFKRNILSEINKQKKIPDKVEMEIKNARKRVQDAMHKIGESFNCTVSPSEAKKKISDAEKEINDTAAILCNSLESQLGVVQDEQLAACKAIYDKHLRSIISSLDGERPALNGIEKSLSIKRLTFSFDGRELEKHTDTHVLKHGNKDKAWYKPWTWFDDKYSAKEIKEVKLGKFHANNIAPITGQFMSTIHDAQSELERSATHIRDLFEHELIPKAEAAMHSYMLQIQDSTKSKSSVEAKLSEAQQLKKYLEKVKVRIDHVASL